MEKSIHQEKYHILITMLRQKRENLGITQLQLANMLNLSQAVIIKIETCERRLDVIELIDICEAIGVEFIDFISEFNVKFK